MTFLRVFSYLRFTSLRWQKQLVHAATAYYQSSEVFSALKNSHVVLVLILIFLCTLWNGLFFKILCDYCSFWFLFYNLPVYSLCHFSIGLFLLLLLSAWAVCMFCKLCPCGCNVCKYFVPFCRLSFHFVYGFLGCAKACKFD